MLETLREALVDRYAIERELGEGGMASVWLARDLRHERAVAIKVLHPALAGAIGTDRFLREIRVTAGLQHPHIVPLLDSGTITVPGDTVVPWYAMAYVPGESLRARLTREHQLPIDTALAITDDVAGALAAAHKLGIVHRDVKPENVLLADGRAYVCDFGIAKALADTGGERLTSTGFAIGTPAYMSPEQAAAAETDARSDQYSLASMLYEMLAGEPPFTGATAQAIVARRLAEPARPLRPVRPGVSAPLEQVVLRALERVPADRFPDLAAFAQALRAGEPTTPRRARAVPVAALLLVALLLLGATAGGMLWARRGRVVAAPGRDAVAAALFRRAMRSYDQRTDEGVTAAITALKQAVERDSTYAAAWNGLARAYCRALGRRFTFPGIARDSVLRLAVAAADRGLEADPLGADTWITQAIVSFNVDPTQSGPQLRAARHAVALDSLSGPAWGQLAIALADSGDVAGGLAAWRRCANVAPTNTQCLAFLALGEYWRGRFDSAAAWADSANALEPAYVLGRFASGAIELERGRLDRAQAEFEAARRLGSGVETVHALAGLVMVEGRRGRLARARPVLARADSLARAYLPASLHTAAYLAAAYAAVGDRSRALQWLERYEPVRDLHFQLHLACDPTLTPLRGDRRFQAMLVQPATPHRCGG